MKFKRQSIRNSPPKVARILHVVISLDIGGLERFVLDLINTTSSAFDHTVVCLQRPGDLAFLYDFFEIISLDLNPGLQVGAAFRLAEIVKSRGINLIHTHNEKAQFYGALAGLFTGVPVVHTKHGRNDSALRSVVRNNLAAMLCKKIVAVSSDAARQCIVEEKILSAKVMTILNGADTKRFRRMEGRPHFREQFDFTPSVPVIGIVARLAEIKDHATLLAACNILAQTGLDFKLLIVGDGPLRIDLEARTERYGMTSSVVFTGSRQDVPELMCAMDIFVLSSISEGISLTLIEAMACELPVVATAVGGNIEVVIDGETGFLVPPRDPEVLAGRLKTLLLNQSLRQKFGKKGRQRAEAEFCLSKAAEQYVGLYRSIIFGN